MADRAKNVIKNRDSDRILVLKPMEGKTPMNSIGSSDPRLFTGENNVHAIMNKETALWYLKMDHGILPQALSQQFTSFNKLFTFVKDYYNRRNIEITEVID